MFVFKAKLKPIFYETENIQYNFNTSSVSKFVQSIKNLAKNWTVAGAE